MFEQDFERLRESIIAAGPTDCIHLLPQFEAFVEVICRTKTLDEYTGDAFEGVRISLNTLTLALARGSECISKYTIARLRYTAREATLAAQDEWRRQNSKLSGT